jgi:hypothetical protein
VTLTTAIKPLPSVLNNDCVVDCIADMLLVVFCMLKKSSFATGRFLEPAIMFRTLFANLFKDLIGLYPRIFLSIYYG